MEPRQTSSIAAARLARSSSLVPAAEHVPSRSGFWSFLLTLLLGTFGLAVLSILAVLAGSAWLTVNQRVEIDKPQPWTDPSFTTTAVTTGGFLAPWMDSDGNLDNGYSYITGIYNLWKAKRSDAEWMSYARDSGLFQRMPPCGASS